MLLHSRQPPRLTLALLSVAPPADLRAWLLLSTQVLDIPLAGGILLGHTRAHTQCSPRPTTISLLDFTRLNSLNFSFLKWCLCYVTWDSLDLGSTDRPDSASHVSETIGYVVPAPWKLSSSSVCLLLLCVQDWSVFITDCILRSQNTDRDSSDPCSGFGTLQRCTKLKPLKVMVDFILG